MTVRRHEHGQAQSMAHERHEAGPRARMTGRTTGGVADDEDAACRAQRAVRRVGREVAQGRHGVVHLEAHVAQSPCPHECVPGDRMYAIASCERGTNVPPAEIAGSGARECTRARKCT